MSDDKKSQDISNKLDRYTFKKTIHNTTQGRIYDAYDDVLKQDIIIKETWKKLAKLKVDKRGIHVNNDIKNEININKYLSKLDCNNIFGFNKIMDEWDDDECFYYSMSKGNGGNLMEYIQRIYVDGAMAEYALKQSCKIQITMRRHNSWIKNVRYIFQQICKTVWWMHKMGVAHMNLNPENIIIMKITKTKDLLVNIIDFSLSYKKNDDTKTWKLKGHIGLIEYMAPEMYDYKIYDPRKIDIWYLGVLLWVMVIGKIPFKIPNRDQDISFKNIMDGKIEDVLKEQKRLRLITNDIISLLKQIFKDNENRITMDNVLDSEFVGLNEWKLDYIKANNTKQ